MKPIDQTTFGFPGGNCFSACVASLLEIPLDDVPYFMGDDVAGDDGWFKRFAEWLAARGFYPLCFELKDTWRPAGLCILSGKSPRELANPNALHSVVADGAVMVHDPHPSRNGLLDQRDVVLLIPMDPARPARSLASLQALVRRVERIGGHATHDEQGDLRIARAVLAEER